jgi:hypothetical protein
MNLSLKSYIWIWIRIRDPNSVNMDPQQCFKTYPGNLFESGFTIFLVSRFYGICNTVHMV